MIMSLSHEQNNTAFKITRFGNVLGSSGSVIPVFEKQIREGKALTVTHPEMVRFFMSIREAARLVIKACTLTDGVIFTLDMGKPVKIYDLAVNLIKLSGLVPKVDINIEITGLRPGEKLYEELLMREEGLRKTENELIFIGKPIEFDARKFREQLKNLENVTSDEPENIRQLVAEIVPTYKYSQKKPSETESLNP